MMSRRFAGRVAWRRPGWLPGQAARRPLSAIHGLRGTCTPVRRGL